MRTSIYITEDRSSKHRKQHYHRITESERYVYWTRDVWLTLLTPNPSLQLSAANSSPSIASHTSLSSWVVGLRCWDGGWSGGQMVRCWDVASRELLQRRFEAFFGVVPPLPFNIRVDNWCLNVNPYVSVMVSQLEHRGGAIVSARSLLLTIGFWSVLGLWRFDWKSGRCVYVCVKRRNNKEPV